MSKLGETVVIITSICVIAGVAFYMHQHVSCVQLPFTTACIIGK